MSDRVAIVDHPIDAVARRADDDQRPWRTSDKGGRYQRARRPPSSVECGRVARFELGDHFGEAFLRCETLDQGKQPRLGMVRMDSLCHRLVQF